MTKVKTPGRALHDAIAAVAPIDGVSVGDLNNKATWRIDFQASANQGQRTAAHNVLNAWVAPSAAALFKTSDFLALFTNPELTNLFASTDMQVKLFLFSSAGDGVIDMSDPATKTALDHMVSLNIISNGRENVILGSQPPAG